jgi:hypothetical protein
MEYKYYSSSFPKGNGKGKEKMNKISSYKRKRKNKKPMEVKEWQDEVNKEKIRKFISPKYLPEEMKQIKWADIDDLTDEEFYGYYVDLDEE